MADNRMSVLPEPHSPAPPMLGPCPVRRCLRGQVLVWLGGCQPGPVCARPLILDGEVRTQSRKQMERQPAWSRSHPLAGLLRGGPNARNSESSPTFDDVCVFQRQLPQQLVFAGCVNDAGCRVPVGSHGVLRPGQGSEPRGTTAPTFPARLLPPQPLTDSWSCAAGSPTSASGWCR